MYLTDEVKKLLATKHKNMQIVWVPLPILDEIAQIAEQLHLALNQTIIVLAIHALRAVSYTHLTLPTKRIV